VGDGPWQYTRLTGAVAWDAENLGVCLDATPTESSEGLGLIPGDYFIAGNTFTEDSVEYKFGYAYTYNGASWDVLDLSLSENSGKALQLASSLFSSGINVTDATASIWGWFQNLVAQNAVIQSLIARNVTVEDENGVFSFRAHAYDANGNRLAVPIFEISYNGVPIFSVDVTTGLTVMRNANVSGDFSSDGFATSKASDAPLTITAAVTDLVQYYKPYKWVDRIWDASYAGVQSLITSAQKTALQNIGFDTSYLIVNSSRVYTTSNLNGTYRGTSFTEVQFFEMDDSIRGIVQLDAKVSNGVLYIVMASTAHFLDYSEIEDETNPSSVIIGSTTYSWTDNGTYLGYLMTSSYLASLISSFTIPTATDLQITSGTISINGTTIDLTQVNAFLQITTSFLKIYTTDSSDVLQDEYIFSDGSYYTSTAFSLTSVVLATSKDGIKTKHIVPMSGSSYDIGTQNAKYDKVYANEFHGIAYFS